MNKKQELLDEYSNIVGGDDNMSIEGFLNFLVKKIQEIEQAAELLVASNTLDSEADKKRIPKLPKANVTKLG